MAKALLGFAIVAFASYLLFGKKHREITKESRMALLTTGLIAGVCGGAFGMNGPPVVVYGTLRGWTPAQTRATLQGYFVPASLLVVAGYLVSGLWTERVGHVYLMSLVPAVPAIFVGRVLNRKFDRAVFGRCVHAGLICTGLALIIEAFL